MLETQITKIEEDKMPRAKNRGKASSSFVAGNANRRRIDAESVKQAKKRGGGQ